MTKNNILLPMNDYHYSFVRFRTTLPASSGGDTIYEAEPIRVLPSQYSLDDMQIDGPTTIQIQHQKRGREKIKYFETAHKRLRTTSTKDWEGREICNHNDGHTSSELHALSIDLIVSHIIGFLPWKQQVVSCSRVSKLWNHATMAAPMTVLLFPRQRSPKTEQSNPFPRVLEPCHFERSFNEMSWKLFSNMQNTRIMGKMTRLDIWGDLAWDQEFKNHHERLHLTNFGHLEELYLRYMSLDSLLDIFPESKHPRFLELTKLVVKGWGSQQPQNSTKKDEEERQRESLRQRIRFHAPNTLILQMSV